jgi:ankyrin repeat protein
MINSVCIPCFRITILGVFLFASCRKEALPGYDRIAQVLRDGDHYKLVELLQDGVDPNVADEEGMTPLHVAVANGDFRSCMLLLQYGANAAVEDASGLPAISFSASPEIIMLLLQHGASPQFPSRRGWMPIHTAASTGDVSCVVELIRAGAYVNCLTRKGISPLFVAVQNGHEEVAKVLIKNGADTNQSTYDGVTVGDAAIESGLSNLIDEE